MLASSSQATPPPEFMFVSLPNITDVPPNTHIFWLEPSETHRGYSCHAFHPSGRKLLDKQAVPVIFHRGMWYTLRHKAGNSFPHLRAEHPDISLFNVQQPTQIEEPEPETIEPIDPPTPDSESDVESVPNPENDSLLQAIQLTPLTTPSTRTSTPLLLMATMSTTTFTITQTVPTLSSTSAPTMSSTTAQPPAG